MNTVLSVAALTFTRCANTNVCTCGHFYFLFFCSLGLEERDFPCFVLGLESIQDLRGFGLGLLISVQSNMGDVPGLLLLSMASLGLSPLLPPLLCLVLGLSLAGGRRKAVVEAIALPVDKCWLGGVLGGIGLVDTVFLEPEERRFMDRRRAVRVNLLSVLWFSNKAESLAAHSPCHVI